MSELDMAGVLRAENAALWQALLENQLVRGIGDGSLSRERFRFYLQQDRLYLVELARALALTAAHADTIEDMELFVELLQVTLNRELPSLEATAAAAGLTADELSRAEPGLATSAYGNALVRTAGEGSPSDMIAALLPCQTGYVYIADHLRGVLPLDPLLRSWVVSYGSNDMRQLAARFEHEINARAERASVAERMRWSRLYRRSLTFELLFFEAAWRQQLWPTCPPTQAGDGAVW